MSAEARRAQIEELELLHALIKATEGIGLLKVTVLRTPERLNALQAAIAALREGDTPQERDAVPSETTGRTLKVEKETCPYGCIIDGGVLILRDRNCRSEHGRE